MQIVADHLKEPLDPRDVRDGKPPEDLDGAIDWLNAGAQALIDAVEKSQTLYCGVSAMIAKACPITYRVLLNGAQIHEGCARFPGPG